MPKRSTEPQLVRTLIAFFVLVAFGCSGGSPTGAASDAAEIAEEPGPSGPATAAEAARFFDLRKMPLYAGSEAPGWQTVSRLTYNSPGSARQSFEFVSQWLRGARWKKLDGSYESDESCSATFTKSGFTVSVSASQAAVDDDSPAKSMVMVINHGNVPTSSLPKPPGTTVLYDGPAQMMYTAQEGVKETADAVKKLLAVDGWAPYGSAGDTRDYKRNAILLKANVMSAPAQDAKTVISYSTEQLSADLPAPADALDIRYSEPPVQLLVDFDGAVAEADQWYRDAMSKLGWTPTTEKPVQEDFESWVVYRNEAKEMAETTFREVDDFTRVHVEYASAEEVAEMDRRFEEKKKEYEAERANQAAASDATTPTE